jgi:hypothetical protein
MTKFPLGRPVEETVRGGATISQQTDGIQQGLDKCIPNGDVLDISGQAPGDAYTIGAPLVINGPVSVRGASYTGYGNWCFNPNPGNNPIISDPSQVRGSVLVSRGVTIFDIQTTDRVELSALMLLGLDIPPGSNADGIHLGPPSTEQSNVGGVLRDLCIYGFDTAIKCTNCTGLLIDNPWIIEHQTTGISFAGVGSVDNFRKGGDWTLRGGYYHTGAVAPKEHVLVLGTCGHFDGGKMQPCGYVVPGIGIHLAPTVDIEPLRITGMSLEGLETGVFFDPSGGVNASEIVIGNNQMWCGTTIRMNSGGRYWIAGVVLNGNALQSGDGKPVVALDGVQIITVAFNSFTSFQGVPCKGILTGSFLRNYKISANTNVFGDTVTP